MNELPFRQVHLDFHTSEKIKGIGSKFDKTSFQDALKMGYVNSITIFAKCHHGWGYNNSETNERHPELEFDLLGKMIEACHEIGVRTPIYLSAGLDEKMARRHPEWVRRFKDESTTWVKDFTEPGYHEMCMNSPYLEYLTNQVIEMIEKYKCDCVWLDIVGERICYCHNCVQKALDKGLDPYDEEVMKELGKETYRNYTTTINEAVHNRIPKMMIFHNSGHITRGRKDLEAVNSHLEIESLPTGGWGYDNFPLSARYVQHSDKEYLGMTGKFNTTWGEFGGFKHPNALRYETSLCLAVGAKCSVGDQMHPLGVLDTATYELIGSAYKEIKHKEAWCIDTMNKAEIAYISTEASYEQGYVRKDITRDEIAVADIGALRVLQEGQYLFDIIDCEMEFSKYKMIIFPDIIRFSIGLVKKVTEYCKQGGKIVLTGESGFKESIDEFAVEVGCKVIGKNKYRPSYCRPNFRLKSLGKTAFVMYEESYDIVSESGKILALSENSYFNRTTFNFSSHQHTPNNPEDTKVGIVKYGNSVYISWKMFSDYTRLGEVYTKEILHHIIDELLEEKMIQTEMPVPSIVTVRKQEKENRDIIHLLYGVPIKKGKVEVIEGIPTLRMIGISYRTSQRVKEVVDTESGEKIPFTEENNQICFSVKEINCHKMISVNY